MKVSREFKSYDHNIGLTSRTSTSKNGVRYSVWNTSRYSTLNESFISSGQSTVTVRTPRKSFPPPDASKLFFTTICTGFKEGKEDHYYTLSIRSTIVAVLSLTFLPLCFSIPAMLIAKKVNGLGYYKYMQYKSLYIPNIHVYVYIHCTCM